MAKKSKSTAKDAGPSPVAESDSWRAQDDLRTLSRAAEIGRDKQRLRAAKAEAKKQMASLSQVAGSSRGSKQPGGRSDRRKRLENVEL